MIAEQMPQGRWNATTLDEQNNHRRELSTSRKEFQSITSQRQLRELTPTRLVDRRRVRTPIFARISGHVHILISRRQAQELLHAAKRQGMVLNAAVHDLGVDLYLSEPP